MERDKERFRVLFLCTGNSCRSPMAEGILKKMLRENEVENFEVGSAGISTLNGVPASLFAMEVSRARNVDLSQHRSRQLNRQILKKADLILAMSDEHLEYVGRIDKNALRKAHLLKAFSASKHPIPENGSSSNEDESPGVLYVKDPIGGSIDDYNQCFMELEQEIGRVFRELIGLAEEKNLKDGS
jgi:protein-tyrosine-phosphatase